MSSIRLISDDVTIHFSNLDHSALIGEKNYILRKPTGKFSVVCFASHASGTQEQHPFVAPAIKKNIGIIYVCETLPKNPIIDDHIVYIECPYRWYIHTLFMNPLQFHACFAGPHSERMARAFSEFTKYHIPYLKNQQIFDRFTAQVESNENNILLEITGGVGDHLMTIPTIKTLAAQGKNVFILCERHRMDCFSNLSYISGLFTERQQVNVSQYDKIIVLHFGQILNDYRSELNKQNRIFSVAALCGLDKKELVIQRPEIIFSEEELERAKKKWACYPNKLFFGFDSDRADAKMSESFAQEKINAFKTLGYTVFTSSRRKYNLQNCTDLSQQLSLRELFALMAVMDIVVTIDTAFLHIAGALEKKTFVLMNFFDPSWRCGTYKNCTPMTPNTSCFPCVARQFVLSSEWKCHDRPCFSYFNWEKLYRELRVLKLRVKEIRKVPEEIHSVPNALVEIPIDGQTQEKNLLVADNDGLGDILMLTPSLEALANKGYKLTVMTRYPEVFQNLEYVSKVLKYGTIIPNRPKIYPRKMDVSYKLSQYEFEWCRQHRILATAHLLDLKARDLKEIRPQLVVTSEEILALEKFNIPKDKKILCCGFTSADIRREYPRDSRQKFLNALQVAFPQIVIILVGDTAGDAKWAVKHKQPFKYTNCIDLRSKTTLRELFALVSQSDYCFSIDSAILHIAGAFKKPTVFIPSSIKGEWRSYPETVICPLNENCYPCNERNCGCSQIANCMKNLSMDIIIEKFKEIIPCE